MVWDGIPLEPGSGQEQTALNQCLIKQASNPRKSVAYIKLTTAPEHTRASPRRHRRHMPSDCMDPGAANLSWLWQSGMDI